MGNLTGWHALIILAVVLLIFGAAKLPALAKSLGQSVKILKKEVQTDSSGSSSATSSTESAAATPSSAVTTPSHSNAEATRRD